MSTRAFRRRLAATVRAVLWLVGMLMLLAFPLQRAHSSSPHFRAHEVRRSVARHTRLARTPETAAAEEAYKCPAVLARLLEDWDETEPAINSSTLPTIPVKLFLTRLKLGSSHAGGEDPLLRQ
jgi:hypothetical protein